jgi:hypothetical protein
VCLIDWTTIYIRKGIVLKRSSTLVILTGAVCALSLVFGFARGSGKLSSQSPAQAAAPIAPGLFVASAMPVTIAVSSSNSDRGFAEIPLAINAKAETKITNLNLVLFELSQEGKLLSAESSNGAIDLTTKRSDNLPLRVRGQARSGSALVLALESASGPDGSWQIDLTELLQAAVAVASNKPVPAVNVSQRQDQQSVDYGSNHCARAFALAMHLSRFSESGGMPSFYCDQQTRRHLFSYSSSAKPASQSQ